jgi:hypothetical protein
MKIEEEVVDEEWRLKRIPLMMEKKRERQRTVDEESKTELWSLKRKLLSVDYGEKTRSLPTAAVDEDWRGSREPSILKILSSEIRNLG